MPIQTWSDRIWVVALADEPALSDDLRAAQERLTAAPRCPDVVIDLSALEHINSTNLAQLLRLRKTLVTRDAVVRLAAPRDSVWAVLLTTGLDKIFECHADVATALADLRIRHA